MKDISSGFWLGQELAVTPKIFCRPKSSRQAATMVETGFHSAKYWSALGIPVVGANALDKKVSGKTAMKTAAFATRAERTDNPIKIPIQAIENPNRRRNRKMLAAKLLFVTQA